MTLQKKVTKSRYDGVLGNVSTIHLVKAPLLVLDPSTDREEDLLVSRGPKTSPQTVSLASAIPTSASDSPSSQHPLPHAANAGYRNAFSCRDIFGGRVSPIARNTEAYHGSPG
jgi:hypothetical protein